MLVLPLNIESIWFFCGVDAYFSWEKKGGGAENFACWYSFTSDPLPSVCEQSLMWNLNLKLYHVQGWHNIAYCVYKWDRIINWSSHKLYLPSFTLESQDQAPRFKLQRHDGHCNSCAKGREKRLRVPLLLVIWGMITLCRSSIIILPSPYTSNSIWGNQKTCPPSYPTWCGNWRFLCKYPWHVHHKHTLLCANKFSCT